MSILYSLYVIVVVASVVKAQVLLPVVNTGQGWVQGVTADDGDYYAFYNIHYGGDTSGANRFKDPTPPPTYTDTYEAVDRTILCAQPGPTDMIGVEDCLRLSIFTQNATNTNRQPVFVWLFGEDFTTANPLQHSFKRLVDESAVVVSVNYRLSVFGFLCLGTEGAPGNAGLKDVMQALQWIHDNILEFGGDPDNVILIGHGSGAAMVDYITLSSSSTGLVHKAIALSGSALSPWALTRDPVQQAFTFSNNAIYQGDNIEELENMIITRTANVLVTEVTNLKGALFNAVPFAPCVENTEKFPNTTFLGDTPTNILRSGNYNHVPYIYGYTDWEGSLRVTEYINNQWLTEMQQDFARFIPNNLDLSEDIVTAVQLFYLGTGLNTVEQYFAYHGDAVTTYPLMRSVQERVRTTQESIYLLNFEYQGTNMSAWPYPSIPLTGVPHGQLLNFILDFDLNPQDASVSNDLVERFMNFALLGIPEFDPTDFISWSPATTSILYSIRFHGGRSNNLPEGQWMWGSYSAWNPSPLMRSLWDPLYNQYYMPPVDFPSSATRIFAVAAMILFCHIFMVLV